VLTITNTRPTQHIFSDIAGSIGNSVRFAFNLWNFMNEYGFDGADLDWEYPGAEDRGGTPADVQHYARLCSWIKIKWKIERKNWGLTATLPTSYWYLRWFDMPDLIKYVDYLNLMSYDLHGIWDDWNPIGPYVYAHTNLTEIDLALDLFWRNGIDGSRINLGLGFYGRSFKLTDPSCIRPGCHFSGPADEGPCTKSAGVLSFREIQEILKDDKLRGEHFYDEEAAVNYMTWGQDNCECFRSPLRPFGAHMAQLTKSCRLGVSYDDRRTFQQKIEFANKRGLHGLFIWAIDQDDDGFNALKGITGQDITPYIQESKTLGFWDPNKCWITPCGTSCQEGWSKMVSA
jgi:chitinase